MPLFRWAKIIFFRRNACDSRRICEELNLVAGSELEISPEGGGNMLKLADSELRLVSKKDLLVHHGARLVDLDVAEFIRSGLKRAALAVGEAS